MKKNNIASKLLNHSDNLYTYTKCLHQQVDLSGWVLVSLSIHPPFCLSVRPSIHSFCLSVCPFIHPSVYPVTVSLSIWHSSVCLSKRIPVCQFVYLSSCQYICFLVCPHLPNCLSVFQFIHLSANLSVYLPTHLSVCLSLSQVKY